MNRITRFLTVAVCLGNIAIAQTEELRPTAIINLPFESYAYQNALLVEDQIYICTYDFESSLYTFSITEDSLLVQTDSQAISHASWGNQTLAWNGQYLFAPESYLSAFDLTNPESPQLIEHSATLAGEVTLASAITTLNDVVYSIYLRRDNIYAPFNYLNVIDFSNPAEPVRVYAFHGWGSNSIAVHDGTNNYLVINTPPYVFSLSNPLVPVTVTQSFSDTLGAFVPFGNHFVASTINEPMHERVISIDGAGQLSYADDDANQNFLWFGGKHFDPKDGTRAGIFAGYDLEAEIINLYQADQDGMPILIATSEVISEPKTIKLTEKWMSVTTDDSLYVFEIANLVGVEDHDSYSKMPKSFGLLQSYPNPFNPSTTISYALHEPSSVSLSVYDLTGCKITTLKNAHQPAGHYNTQWNGMDDSGNPVSTGVYFCRLDAGAYSQTIKMLYLK